MTTMRNEDIGNILQKMALTMVHRGPDDCGAWFDTDAGIGLAHRRLAVIDLSPNAKQPMESSCGRYVLAYNGEAYDFRALRMALEKEGAVFKGTGDTEVLLEAVSRWGLKKAVQKLNGMFAFALWDKKERRLFLVRDRIGKKPLYYGWVGQDFIFGSELTALSAHPLFPGEIDRGALALFLRYSYVPAPYSIYNGVYKLMPGGIISVSSDEIDQKISVEALNRKIDFYWSAREAAENGVNHPFGGTKAEAEQVLCDLLYDAVGCRMVSDVPLGALLSGGIDSSSVVSLMQAQSLRPVKTFTIGFNNPVYNEAVQAAAVARHLGTDHTELYVTDREVLDVVPDLPKIYDEPFADSSQIPTYLISRLARSQVTVALTGDGGDELFCGYRRYFRGARIWRANRAAPRSLRLAAAMILRAFSKSAEHRLAKHAIDIMAEDVLEMYINRISSCRKPEAILKQGVEHIAGFVEVVNETRVPGVVHRMMFADMINYLTDDVLAKVDRASMAVSLELRNPILDHRVIEFVWRLPLKMKTDNRQGKLILKRMLERYLPKKLIAWPKHGFGVPMEKWLTGPLRNWVEALLFEKRLEEEGFFEPGGIRAMWADVLLNRRKQHHILWNVLMFQAWNEHRQQYGNTKLDEDFALYRKGIFKDEQAIQSNTGCH